MALGEGPRGYQDWQRVVSWDGPLVFSQNQVLHTGAFLTPVFETSRFAYLGGTASVIKNDTTFRATWYADQAATLQVGERSFVLNHQMLNRAQLHLPNLGPFCQLEWVPAEVGTQWEHFATRIFLTNRVYPLELIPITTVLLQHAFVFPAGENQVRLADSYYSGPARINTVAGGVVSNGTLVEGQTTPTTFVEVDRVPVNTTTEKEQTINIPPGGWRLTVGTTAAVTVTVCVTATPTGSL